MAGWKLLCDNDPVALGIENPDDGAWDMVKFGEHVEQCEICSCATRKIRRQIEDRLRKDRGFFLRVFDLFRKMVI